MSTQSGLSPETIAFVVSIEKEASRAFRVLRETRTISPSGTLFFGVRIPGEDKIVTLNYQGLWQEDPDRPKTGVVDFDGNSYWSEPPGGTARYLKLFRTHPDVQAISHVHTPHLGAYSQAHQTLPLLYVPNRRFRFTAELPVYINRRQAEVDFILEAIEKDRQVPAIVEANGGATVWSWKGLRDLTDNIVLLEEGAQFQILGAALGGSKPFGPGVLEQQWKMGKLVPKDASVADDGTIHYAEPTAQAAE
ncbi:class II aldolase/adducin family protein [Sphingomonas paeninsulae]|jgi:L-ribulose-5-phosphate 4-epimerase|uniref:Class II aldolase/adducin family protein n=1 Tax=Sphingomonas paeninsulae TaxID=2319844 RepID=A0A494TL12_SPHPE|nr:class II aldolase/adducin family protein [Sphingomonas paeninsulae]AYJ87713.1 class II aldolase/adducin family protein [Sphingomonas paeninsulae]